MIREAQGNLLRSGCDALVNPVNCVGVMGKGLALQFARAWPGMVSGYQWDCDRTDVNTKLRPGRLNIYLTPVASPAYIINFPTKSHWRDPSKLDYIRWGLTALRGVIPELNIRSIAVPALGADSVACRGHPSGNSSSPPSGTSTVLTSRSTHRRRNHDQRIGSLAVLRPSSGRP